MPPTFNVFQLKQDSPPLGSSTTVTVSLSVRVEVGTQVESADGCKAETKTEKGPAARQSRNTQTVRCGVMAGTCENWN